MLWLSGMAAVAAPVLGATPSLRWGALPLRGSGVMSLALTAGGEGIVWACTAGDGVWRSLDRGRSWTQQALTPLDGYRAVVTDPLDPYWVYAYGSAGVAKSEDGGATWRSTYTSPVQALAVSASIFGGVYLAGPDLGLGHGGVIQRSSDGVTWSPVSSLPPPLDGPYQLTVFPGSNMDVYATATSFHVDASPVLVQSSDGGTTWTGLGPAPGLLTDLQIDAHDTFYAAVQGDLVVRSRDFGASWEPANSGLPSDVAAGHLALDRSTGALFVTTSAIEPPQSARIWTSADGGASWSLALERDGVRIVALAADYGTVYASSDQASLLISGDGGAHWQVASASFTPAAIDDLTFAGAASAPSLYAAAHTGVPLGVERSRDGGASWQAGNQGLPAFDGPVPVMHLVADRVTAGTLYAEVYGIVYVSKDGGQSWQAGVGTPLIGIPLDVAAGPVAGQIFMVGSTVGDDSGPSAVLRSLDGGVSWTEVLTTGNTGGNPPDRLGALLADSAVFAGGRGGLWQSLDGGNNWAAIGSGLPATQAIVRLRADAAHDLYALLGPGTHQLFRSLDRGATWAAIETGLPAGLPVADLVADPFGTALYAGTAAGVYVSLDGGGHWVPQNDGLGDPRVTRLAADPVHPGVIYAGTAGGLYVQPAPKSPCQGSGQVLCLADGRFA
ncbi:MAG TPA: hypothetical protein VMW75_04510, partial [Thermoanaerobaculia bacterium]|nr:hypothetical protein [Thermoanaerobaculia bacterium]